MTNTPLEDEVRDALHRRVDPLQHAPLTLTDVRGRAGRIQRRRTVAASAAVAAAVAVALPVGLAMNGGAQRTVVQPSTQTPEVTGPVLVDPRSAEAGDAPGVPLVDTTGPTLTAGGEPVGIPESYDQVSPYRDGWIATVRDQGEVTVQVLDSAFTVLGSVPDASLLTIADDGSSVAYAYSDGIRWILVDLDPAVERAEQATPLPDSPLEATARTVGFLPDEALVAAQVDPDDGSETTYVATAGSITELPGFIHAVSASPVTGMVAGRTSSSGGGSCSAVVDGRAGTGSALWDTCDHELGAFSPDGAHLVGFADVTDGPSPTVSILDATTGRSVLDFEVAGARDRVVGIAPEVAWEDDRTLLATYLDGTQQYVVRLGLDGTVERVAGPVVNDDFGLSLRLTPGAMG